MPDPNRPDHDPDTRPMPPAMPPELPEAGSTRPQGRAVPTRVTPSIPPPPPPPTYAREKAKRSHHPAPPRTKADSSFYLPLWSIGFMLLSVALIVACFVILVLGLGGGSAPPSTPRIVIITAQPTLAPRQTLPVLLVSPTLPAGFGPGFGGTIPAFALQGPTLEPVVFTPTPSPAPAIQVGSTVLIISDGGANIRTQPGTASPVVTIGREGQQFIVTGGPQQANDLTWWQLRTADGTITGWAAENDGTNDLMTVISP